MGKLGDLICYLLQSHLSACVCCVCCVLCLFSMNGCRLNLFLNPFLLSYAATATATASVRWLRLITASTSTNSTSRRHSVSNALR